MTVNRSRRMIIGGGGGRIVFFVVAPRFRGGFLEETAQPAGGNRRKCNNKYSCNHPTDDNPLAAIYRHGSKPSREIFALTQAQVVPPKDLKKHFEQYPIVA